MKSYLKFLSRNKLYTAIEMTGLAVSLAFVILTGTYVWQQYATARQNPDRDRIFLYASEESMGMSWCDRDDIDTEIPETELTTRYMLAQSSPVKVGDESFEVDAAYVDKEFFDMFPQLNFVEGTPELMNDPSNVLVSRQFANKIAAGGKDPIGQHLKIESTEGFVIAGIIEDFGRSLFSDTELIFNAKVSPMEDLAKEYGHNIIGNNYTFMRVRSGTDIGQLRIKCADLMKRKYEDAVGSSSYKSRLVSLEDLYFEPTAYMTHHVSRSMLRILIAVVIALLLSAVFNYINLSSALMGKRAKEMATRRLLGEDKRELFLSNIVESIGFTAGCLIFALLIAESFKPLMGRLLQDEIDLSYSPLILLVYATGAILLGSLVGLIPSVQASRYKPIDVIKGTWRLRSKMVFSKVFIVVQNTLSVVLVSIAILMEAQLGHMIRRPVNADTDNIFYIMTGLNPSYAQPLADKLTALPCVEEIGHSSGASGHINVSTRFSTDNEAYLNAKVMLCDSVAFRMMNLIKLEDYGHPLFGSLWLSESSANILNLCDSTEAKILRRIGNLNMSNCEYIGGIYRDIPGAPASEAETIPYTITYVISPEKININNSFLIRTTDESQATKHAILKCFSDYMEELYGLEMNPSTGDFINALLRDGLKDAENTIRLVEIFMFLAVLLSLLGLIAMSTYYAGQRTKDIAVRKVFGGTVMSETADNVRSYMIMVLISCVLGVPIAVYIGSRYLESFAYRITGWWWVCAAAVMLSLVVSLASVLWQTLRAARTNPATELKKE